MSTPQNPILDQVLIDPPLYVCGKRLRPFSFGSMMLCNRLRLTLLTGEAVDETSPDTAGIGLRRLTANERSEQLLAFVYIQTEPLAEVLKAAALGPERFRAEVLLPWSMELDIFQALPQAVTALQHYMEAANASAVDVHPRPGISEETPPPNS